MEPKGQHKHHSILESIINVIIGYGIAVLSQIVIFPFFNIHIPIRDNFLIGIWFTFVSVIRSYLLRRFFNQIMIKVHLRDISNGL